MIPGHIEGAQVNLGAPAGWDPERDGVCGGLPVRIEHVEGHTVLRSAWFPTPAEIAAIVCGAPVLLGIVDSAGHPVVQLGVGEVPA